MTKKTADSVKLTLTLSVNDLVQNDSNHGGYVGSYCIVCKQHGWRHTPLGQSNGTHKAGCRVLKALKDAGFKDHP